MPILLLPFVYVPWVGPGSPRRLSAAELEHGHLREVIPLVLAVAADVRRRAVLHLDPGALQVAGAVEHRDEHDLTVVEAQGVLDLPRVDVAGLGRVLPGGQGDGGRVALGSRMTRRARTRRRTSDSNRSSRRCPGRSCTAAPGRNAYATQGMGGSSKMGSFCPSQVTMLTGGVTGKSPVAVWSTGAGDRRRVRVGVEAWIQPTPARRRCRSAAAHYGHAGGDRRWGLAAERSDRDARQGARRCRCTRRRTGPAVARRPLPLDRIADILVRRRQGPGHPSPSAVAPASRRRVSTILREALLRTRVPAIDDERHHGEHRDRGQDDDGQDLAALVWPRPGRGIRTR